MRIFQTSSKTGCSVKPGRHQTRRVHLLAGFLVLALYCLNYSPAGISLALLVGSFDSTHEARLQPCENGLQVVLHHQHGCVGHRHGVVAKALTFFARPAATGNPDHVIQFHATDNLASQSQILPPTLSQVALPAPGATTISIISHSRLTVSTSPRPPPGECGLLACLRSTVFLI